MLSKASKILSVVAVTAFSTLLQAQTINWGPAGPVYTAGRARNMIVDRNNPNTLYIGSSTSGIFKSVDAGGNWVPLDDQGTVKNISYIAQATDGIVYVATGEGFLRYGQKEKAQPGTGLYKLVNSSLVQVSSGAVTGTVINRLACSPVNAAHLAIASSLGIMISKDGGVSFSPAPGVATSSNIVGMDVKFDGSGKLFCSAGNEKGNPPLNKVRSKVYRSTDASLTSFTDVTPFSSVFTDSIYGRIEIAIAPSNNNVVYVSIANQNTSTPTSAVANSGNLKGLFVSDNGGDPGTWGLILQGTPQLDPLTNGSDIATGDYAQVLTVSPGNPDELLVGGFQTYFFKRDRNKGTTLFPVGQWLKVGNHNALGSPFYLHENIHDIKIIPGSPVKFYFVTDAGVYRSIDLATATDFVPPSFQRFYKGLVTGQFNSVSIERYPATQRPIKFDSVKFEAKPISGFIGGTSGNGLVYFSGTTSYVVQEANRIGGQVVNAEYSDIHPDAAFATKVKESDQDQVFYRSSNVKTSAFVPMNINRYMGPASSIAPFALNFENKNYTSGTPFKLWENEGSTKNTPDSVYFYNDTLRFQASMQGVATLTTQTTFTFSAARPNKYALIDSIAIRTGTVLVPTTPTAINIPFTGTDKKDIMIKLANNYTVGPNSTVPPITTTTGPFGAAGVTLNPQTLLDDISVTFAAAPFANKTTSLIGTNDAAAYYRVFATIFYKYKAGDSISVVDNLITNKTTTYTTVLKKPLSWAYGSNVSYTLNANTNPSIPSSTYILNPGGISQSSPQFVVSPSSTTSYTISQRGTYTLTAVPVVYTITAVTSSVVPTPTYVLMPDNVTQSVPEFTVNPATTTSYTITELFSSETTQSVVSTSYLANPGNYTASNVYVVTPTVNTTYTFQAISTNTQIGTSTSKTYTTLAVNTVSTVGSGTRAASPYNPLVKIGTYYSSRLAIGMQHQFITGTADAVVVSKNALSLNDPLNVVRVSQSGCYTDDATGKPTFNTITISGRPTVIEWSKGGTEIYYATTANKLYRVSHITDILDYSNASFAGKFSTDVYKYSDPPTSNALNPNSPYRTTEIGSFNKPITSISVSNNDSMLVVTLNEPTSTGTVVVTNPNNTDIRKLNSSNVNWANKSNGFPTDMGVVYCSLIANKDQKKVFLGTDIGVMMTNDITANPPVWTNVNNGQLPRIQVYDIKQQTIEAWGSYNSGVIYVATNGRGVWSTDAFFQPYIVGVEEFEETVSTYENHLTIFPNPTSNNATIRFDGKQGEDATIYVTDINGRIVHSDRLGKLDEGQIEYRLETNNLQSGMYIINISSNSGINRVSKLIVTK